MEFKNLRNMRTYQIIAIVVGLSVIGVLCGCIGFIILNKSNNEPHKPPHIILIVADDLGWNDVSFHGANQIPTPNIDALAYNGVILNRHYVLPTCTPTRTSLMTGRYAIREGMQGEAIRAAEPLGVPLNVNFMPEFLRDLGYKTHLVGKWNLGYYTKKHTPIKRGFDTFFGYYNGFISYFNKTTNLEMNNSSDVIGYDLHRDGPNGLKIEFNNTQYFTDLITNEAEKIIRSNGNKKQLFLEIAHLAAHATFSKTNAMEVRNSTENDQTFGYIEDEKRRSYAGVIKAMDESVGRIVKALSDNDMLKNSIIVFMSDNGAARTGYLANAGSNYPLRGIKDTLFEGGIRSVACIFSPLIKKSQKLSEKYVHVTDWLPTLYSAAGGNVTNLGQIDGFDQWDSLVYDNSSPRQKMLLNIDELRGNEAAIVGRYKIVKAANHSFDGYYGDTGNNPAYPLYNLSKALNSVAGLAISQIPGFFSSTENEALQLRNSTVVTCDKSSNYSTCFNSCLFDIEIDPCETLDLSKSKPKVFESLKAFIDTYREKMVRQKIVKVDPCAFPRYFNGTWMPWRRDDVNSSTIIPESICNHFDQVQNNTTIKETNTNNIKNTTTINKNTETVEKHPWEHVPLSTAALEKNINNKEHVPLSTAAPKKSIANFLGK